jgi:glycosyltransferase involved in cell wall biosynthesis
MPKISVIIPAFNEEKYIRYPLDGLKRQSFRDFETIVVDGGSKDRTRNIAKRYARVIIEKKPGIGRARNAGARAAGGDILVFLDSDTKPSKGLLKAYSSAFSDGFIAATGPIYPLEKTSVGISLGYKLVSRVVVKLSIAIGIPTIIGSNFAILRSAFESVHGFNPNLMTYEDWDLSSRIKGHGKVKFINEAYVYASIRRVAAWGIAKYFAYHLGNALRYMFTKKAKSDYGYVR